MNGPGTLTVATPAGHRKGRGPVARALVAAALLMAGCAGTDVGNPQRDTRSLELVAFLEDAPGAEPITVPGATLHEVWLVVERVRFHEAATCAQEPPPAVDTPFVVELISGAALPETPRFFRPGADFCKVRVHWGRLPMDALPLGAPAELADRSVLIRGTRADGVPFTIRGRLDEPLILTADVAAFSLGDGAVFLAAALDRLFGDFDLTALGGGDPLLLDRTTDPPAFARFRKALRRSFRLFEDLDRDGVLGPPEWAKALAKGRDGDDAP